MTVSEMKDLVQLVVAAGGAVAVVTGFFGWLNLRARNAFTTEVRAALAQLRPNGGSTLADVVSRIDTELARVVGMQRLLVGVTNGAVWECDAHGKCVYASPSLCEMYGLDKEQMLGLGWTAAVDTQAQRTAAAAEWQEAVSGGLPYCAEYVVRNIRTGERVQVRSEGHPLISSGKVIGFIGTVDKVAAILPTQLSVSLPGVPADVRESRGHH